MSRFASPGTRTARTMDDIIREIEQLRREMQSLPSRFAGGSQLAGATLIAMQTGGNVVKTITTPSKTFYGVLSVATGVATVPVATPVVGNTYADGLGIGQLSNGTKVWVVTKATVDAVDHEDTNITIAAGNSILSRQTVGIPLSGDPSTIVTCYLPWII